MLPLFLFVLPGMIAYALSQKNMLILDKPDQALPALAQAVLPLGLKGMMVAGLLAALMSSLSSVFNSCSTLITYDFYKVRNPNATEKQLFRVGQISTVLLVICGIVWIPLMKLVSGGLFTYIQSIQAYISPPIACVFLLGLFIKRLNSKGAMASLIVGFILGITRLLLEMNKESLDGILYNLATMNFLHIAILLFVICTVVLISVSFLTKPDTDKDIDHITYNWSEKLKINHDTKLDAILSASLILIIFITWMLFS